MEENFSLNSSIGKRVQLARKAAGLTQMILAERIGVSTQYISDLERGVVGASVPTIIKISETLNVPTDYILLGKDPTTGYPTDLFLEINRYSQSQQKLILQSISLLKRAFSNNV